MSRPIKHLDQGGQGFLLDVADDIDDEEQCLELCVRLPLLRGDRYIKSRGPIRNTKMAAFDIFNQWCKEKGSAATTQVLMDTLIKIGLGDVAETHAPAAHLEAYVAKQRALQPIVSAKATVTPTQASDTYDGQHCPFVTEESVGAHVSTESLEPDEKDAVATLVAFPSHLAESFRGQTNPNEQPHDVPPVTSRPRDSSIPGSAAAAVTPPVPHPQRVQLTNMQVLKLSNSDAQLAWEDILEVLPDKRDGAAPGDTFFSFGIIQAFYQESRGNTQKTLKTLLNKWQAASSRHTIEELKEVFKEARQSKCLEDILKQ